MVMNGIRLIPLHVRVGELLGLLDHLNGFDMGGEGGWFIRLFEVF